MAKQNFIWIDKASNAPYPKTKKVASHTFAAKLAAKPKKGAKLAKNKDIDDVRKVIYDQETFMFAKVGEFDDHIKLGNKRLAGIRSGNTSVVNRIDLY